MGISTHLPLNLNIERLIGEQFPRFGHLGRIALRNHLSLGSPAWALTDLGDRDRSTLSCLNEKSWVLSSDMTNRRLRAPTDANIGARAQRATLQTRAAPRGEENFFV